MSVPRPSTYPALNNINLEFSEDMNGPKLGLLAEQEGYDCGRCGARCPPVYGNYHNISPHLYCFWVAHNTTHSKFSIKCKSTTTTSQAVMESSVNSIEDKFLTGVHTCNKFTRCFYCIRCFQKFAPEMAKNEANNVCRYYDLHVHDPVFTI